MDAEQPPSGHAAEGPSGPGSIPFAQTGSTAFRTAQASRTWRSLLPLVGDLRGYSRGWLRADVLAGVTIAALAVPQAMAYAQTAGMPVAAGLYGLMLPVAAYALLGSSRALVTGPTATAALLVSPAVAPLAGEDPTKYAALAGMLAVLVALVAVVARVARMGWIADYFSAAVLLGFLTGLGLTLIAGQLDDLTGVPSSGDTALQQYWSFLTSLVGGVNGPALLVGMASLAALIIGGRWLPRFPMLLLVTIAAIGVSWAAELGEHGVQLVGAIPAGLPRLSWPSASMSEILLLVPAAIGLFFVSYADAILTARSLADTGLGRPIDADQELLALGGLNLAAGVSGSFPLGSSGSRSAVNSRLGGLTQVVGLVQAATVAVVLLFLTGALALLPKATLGAVIIYAAIGLINIKGWRELARASHAELLIAAITVLGMLTIGLLPSLVLAVLLSILDVVRTSATPNDAILGWSPRAGRFVDVANHRDARVVPGTIVYRLDGTLFFANAQYFTARVTDALVSAPYPVNAFIFDAEAIPRIDTTGADTLRRAIRACAARDVRFVTARLRHDVEQQLERLNLSDALPETSRFPTVRAAVLAVSGVDVQSESPPANRISGEKES